MAETARPPAAIRAAAGALGLDLVWARLRAQPLGLAGLLIVVFVLTLAVFAETLAPHDPNAINVRARLEGPSAEHWLGTDHLGRDNLSRLLIGGQLALTVAFVSISLAMALGIVLGLVAGYGPRWADQALVLVFDTVRSFPTLMFGIALVALVGPSIETIVAVIVITSFPVYARVVRTQTQALRTREFILAERSIGASGARILRVHVLPNILGPLLIIASMDVPIVITIEAGLSFLGLGVRPPAASWGSILNDGYAFIRNSPWPVIAGGVPLIVTTLGFTLLGESLRDLLDPRLRRGP